MSRTIDHGCAFFQAEREEDVEEKIERSSSEVSSRRSRISRGRSSFEEETRSFGRGRSFKDRIRETIREQNSEKDSPSFSPSKSPRNRFTPSSREPKTPAPEASPSPSRKSKSSSPKIVFKKFNRFDRPDRRALLRSKLFGNRPRPRPFGKKPNLDEEETNSIEDKDNNEKEKSSKKPNFPIDNETSPSALVLSAINDEDTLQVKDERRGSESVIFFVDILTDF